MFKKEKTTEGKPIFIKILEYGEEIGLEGTNADLFESWVRRNKLTKNNNEQILSRFLFSECFQKTDISINDKKYILKNEYYFRLIEYRELQEVRKNAREARWLAVLAIMISLIAVLFSVFGTVSLDKDTIEGIGNSVSSNIEKQGK